MDTINIKFSKEFTRKPGSRKMDEGENSGEFHRIKLLQFVKEAIKDNKKLIIDLDGVLGYGTSFLEELFGGLIRNDKVSFDEISNRLSFISKEEPYLIDDIKNYLRQAAKWENQR